MAKKPTKKMLRIHSMQDGFRRAGVAHKKGAVDHELAAFTKEQRKQLEEEPMLVVQEVEVEAGEGEPGETQE